MPAKRRIKPMSEEKAPSTKKKKTAGERKQPATAQSTDKNGKTASEPKQPATAQSTDKNGSASFTHWLVKSEPNTRMENGVDMKFSFDDLKACDNQTSCWDGVRNYQARNFLRDQMKVGHDVFFYHSNCKEPGIVGLCKVVSNSYPDHTQFDKKDPHFDAASKKDNPRWYMVDVQYVRPLKRYILLAELKHLHQQHAKSGGPLHNLALFTKARLSVQPLTQDEWDFILKLEEKGKDLGDEAT